MAWTTAERDDLSPVVDAVIDDLEPLTGKHVLVLCSAEGDVAFGLAQRIGHGRVVGLELSEDMLAKAYDRLAGEPGTDVRFEPAVIDRIPFPDGSFDGLVSEFIVYPTEEETLIGQPEMARVLRPRGVTSITDVLPRQSLPKPCATLLPRSDSSTCVSPLRRIWRLDGGSRHGRDSGGGPDVPGGTSLGAQVVRSAIQPRYRPSARVRRVAPRTGRPVHQSPGNEAGLSAGICCRRGRITSWSA